MIVIGLVTNVANNAELSALTGMADQDIVYHVGDSAAFMFRNNVSTGNVQADDLSGWWLKDTIKCLDLAEYKSYRYAEFDERTKELILNGFIYKSLCFSMSASAQENILELEYLSASNTYPIPYSTKDDSVHYDVIDEADLHAMFAAESSTKRGYIDSGTALKDQIRAAIDAMAVSLIIDNR